MDQWMDGDEWVDRWTDGFMGQTDRQMDRLVGGCLNRPEGLRLGVKSKTGLQHLVDICVCLPEACVGFGGLWVHSAPQHPQTGLCKEELFSPLNPILLLLGAAAWWWEVGTAASLAFAAVR